MCAIAARSDGPRALEPGALLAALLCAIAGTAWALDDSAVTLALADGPLVYTRPQFEISASPATRFDFDAQQRQPRVDMTLLPPRRSALGLSLGVSDLDGPAFSGAAPYGLRSTRMEVGLHG